jgi:hypothetical protein
MTSRDVPPFNKVKPLCPLVRLFKNKTSQIGFQALVDHLCFMFNHQFEDDMQCSYVASTLKFE